MFEACEAFFWCLKDHFYVIYGHLKNKKKVVCTSSFAKNGHEPLYTLVIPFGFLPPYLAALLAPEVLVLAEDEDILEAMVSLGDEIGLNVE